MLFIFDVGGVLTNNAPLFTLIPNALHITTEEWEYFLGPQWENGNTDSSNPFKTNIYLELTEGKITTDQFWEIFKQRSGISADLNLWSKFFEPVRNQKVYEIIQSLKQKNRVVGGTNTIEEHYNIHMQHKDYDIFHKTYCSQKLGIAKPSPNFWQKILETERIQPQDAFFIDDRLSNTKAAQKLGIKTHTFTTADNLLNAVKVYM